MPKPDTVEDVRVGCLVDGSVSTEVVPVSVDGSRLELTVGLPGVDGTALTQLCGDPMAPVDYLPSPTPSELRRRLPVLGRLNDELASATEEILHEECPSHYWTYPASTSGDHHPPDERGLHGQWLHTRRLTRQFETVAETASRRHADRDGDQFGLSETAVQHGRAAICLHDVLKFGRSPDGRRTRPDHDSAGATLLSEYDIPQPVVDCVASHNGPWATETSPSSFLEVVFHHADMLTAAVHNTALIAEPPAELLLARALWRLRTRLPDPEQYTVVVE